MKLIEHMRTLTAAEKAELAKRVGIKKIYLHQIAGGAEPSALIAARIQCETNYAVSVYEIRPSDAEEIWPRAAA